MFNHQQLHFFQQKITDLKSAVFYNLSNAVLKIPNCLATAVHVDEVGQVWFFVNRPLQCINEFDKEFQARLHFLQKGKDFFLNIEGKAHLVTDPEEINALMGMPEVVQQKARTKEILVKLKVCNIQYTEKQTRAANNWIEIIHAYLNKLFHARQPGYRPFTIQPDTVSF